MQASKISIGGLYALDLAGVLREDGDTAYMKPHADAKLVRFRVRKIVTTRTQNGPGGLESVVHGDVDLVDKKAFEHIECPTEIKPSRLLGEWDDFAELVERANRDREERHAADKKYADTMAEIVRRLEVIFPSCGVKVGYYEVEFPCKTQEAADRLLDAVTNVMRALEYPTSGGKSGVVA